MSFGGTDTLMSCIKEFMLNAKLELASIHPIVYVIFILVMIYAWMEERKNED